MEGDFAALLRFAELIQARLKVEENESIKRSLNRDLKKVKDQIGRIVLEMPADAEIKFPNIPEETCSSMENIPRITDQEDMSIASESFNESESSVTISSGDMAAKFDAFLKEKTSKAKTSRPRSRIPVPQMYSGK